ncbi:MAG: LCP family protein [Clostridiales bacterium]|nr:LCP family protein [Clostridiales bacterium]
MGYSQYPKVIRQKMRKRERRRSKVIIVAVLCAVLFITACGCAAFIVMRSKGKSSLSLEAPEEITGVMQSEKIKPVVKNSGKIINYDGKEYAFNEDTVAFLFMGLDKEIAENSNGPAGTAGQTDVLIVAVWDTAKNKIQFLVIPRDTLADINVFYTDGNYKSIMNAQICLAFAYGSGGKDSCENVLSSVSRLLMGVKIKQYFCLDLDGVPALNDLVGGVTLTPVETFGNFVKGKQVTLLGQDAENYIRLRDFEKIDADNSRRLRQKQYLEAFAGVLTEKIKINFGFSRTFYNEASKYSVTNISPNEAAFLASEYMTKRPSADSFITVPGKYQKGETSPEYIPDNAGLFRIVLDLFYTEV